MFLKYSKLFILFFYYYNLICLYINDNFMTKNIDAYNDIEILHFPFNSLITSFKNLTLNCKIKNKNKLY